MSNTTEFWQGDFGQEYQKRNRGRVPNNVSLFAEILGHIPEQPNMVLELGCGEGQNLQALQPLLPNAALWGVELNPTAATVARESLGRQGVIGVGDACTYRLPARWVADLVFTKGLLIHIPPERHFEAMQALWFQSRRWILMCEYYSPRIEEAPYRGHAGKLWKNNWVRVFAESVPSTRWSLRAYGFRYHADPRPYHSQDDLTWFLIEKEQSE